MFVPQGYISYEMKIPLSNMIMQFVDLVSYNSCMTLFYYIDSLSIQAFYQGKYPAEKGVPGEEETREALSPIPFPDHPELHSDRY